VTSKFCELPDYPAFRDVQQALWGAAEIRGAALMVGAGFSRLATPVSGDASPLPLWSDFQRRMAEKLYPLNRENAPYDPLRLAEEYRASLGQASLENLIRELVPDKKWLPGKLHQLLVRLPWTDILTTNWDTLLERAAGDDPERVYEIVVTPQDVARTRSPRIVKLHGSLPSNPPFIFTQEDYRTYPMRFAPFVNLAQQVLLENELCLIGFSGNDPNFLQWIGWVRDQLGRSARPIRLVGVLDLQPSQRALFANQHITPIDLGPLVAGRTDADRHAEAMQLFIDELYSGKPVSPGKWVRDHPELRQEQPEDIGPLLAAFTTDRETYPGWLVPPSLDRYRLRWETGGAANLLSRHVETMSNEQKASAAFELCWRFDQSFWAIPDWLAKLGSDVVAGALGNSERSHYHFICLCLAKAARNAGNASEFESLLSKATELASSADDQAAIAYERCLWFRDHLDFQSMETELHLIKGADPAWMLRKASMLALLQREREAALLIKDCAQEIRNRRAQDPHSVWLISREAWANFLLRHAGSELRRMNKLNDDSLRLDEWPVRYTEYRCDPWDELRSIDDDLDKEIEHRSKRIKRESPRFDAGTYRRHGHGEYWRSDVIAVPWNELNALVDHVGLVRFNHVNLVETRFERAGALLERSSLGDWLSIARATRSREEGLIEEAFSRVTVAQMPLPVAEELFEILRKAIDYGRSRLWLDDRFEDGKKRPSGWVEEVRLLLEIASRVAIRLNEQKAIEVFVWACDVGRDSEFCHWWLYEPLSNFMERCLDAIPLKSHETLVGHMLNFPIVDPDNHGMNRHWPNFSNRLAALENIERTGADLNEPIARSIEAVRSLNPEIRTRGVLRLLPLFKHDVLMGSEVDAFTSALWGQRDGPTYLPRNTDVYPSGFLLAPEPAEGSITESFEAEIVRPAASGSIAEVAMVSIARAGSRALKHIAPLSSDNALSILKHLIAWHSANSENDTVREDESDLGKSVGLALSKSIMPTLRTVDIPPDMVMELFDLSRETRLPAAMAALPEIARRTGCDFEAAVERIRLALASSKPDIANAAVNATVAWSTFAVETGSVFPPELATEIANNCLARRPKSVYGAFYAATGLAKSGQFSPDDVRKLIAALDLLLIESDYENVLPNDPLAVSLSLLRRECVRLSAALATVSDAPALTKWLQLLAIDPMPEVRFALSENFESDD